MKTKSYYNEIDPFAAQWLRNLIDAGHIAPGDVDTRSITEVTPDDLQSYTQCHFFAGIGVWSYALRLAGWPDSRKVWTGSAPCQPFSAAGNRGGTDDIRHLWPVWARLIRECEPATIFGEQVASNEGLSWLDIVQDDLESAGYTVGAVDLCAAGAGAPHIRQRLYFVAHTSGERRRGWSDGLDEGEKRKSSNGAKAEGSGVDRPLPNAASGGRNGRGHTPEGNNSRGNCAQAEQQRRKLQLGVIEDGGNVSALANKRIGRRGHAKPQLATTERGGYWADCTWIKCADGKQRPIPTEPEFYPLVNGTTARVGRLRAYGNAIVAPLAAQFIHAYMDVE